MAYTASSQLTLDIENLPVPCPSMPALTAEYALVLLH